MLKIYYEIVSFFDNGTSRNLQPNKAVITPQKWFYNIPVLLNFFSKHVFNKQKKCSCMVITLSDTIDEVSLSLYKHLYFAKFESLKTTLQPGCLTISCFLVLSLLYILTNRISCFNAKFKPDRQFHSYTFPFVTCTQCRESYVKDYNCFLRIRQSCAPEKLSSGIIFRMMSV